MRIGKCVTMNRFRDVDPGFDLETGDASYQFEIYDLVTGVAECLQEAPLALVCWI